MKTRKKFLSVLFVVFMALCFVPTISFAAGLEGDGVAFGKRCFL